VYNVHCIFLDKCVLKHLNNTFIYFNGNKIVHSLVGLKDTSIDLKKLEPKLYIYIFF